MIRENNRFYLSNSAGEEQLPPADDEKASYLSGRSADRSSAGKTYNWSGDRINGDKVMGDKVAGDKVMRDKIVHHHSQDLAQAAQAIKALLEQLDRDYDRTTPTGQAMISAKAIEAIENNPTLKARIANALKEGSTVALETAIDHPVVKPLVAMLKGFMA